MNNEIYGVFDIGGTKILFHLIDEEGNSIYSEKIATPKPVEPSGIIEIIEETISKTVARLALSVKSVKSVGICIAGFVDSAQGIIYQAPNLEWNEKINLATMVENRLNCSVLIENDASAAVVGEVIFGAARGHENAVYITVSTGIGGGLFLNGRLYRGTNGFAGEIGHIKPFGKNRPCKCGGMDCLETWASGSAIAAHAADLLLNTALEQDDITTGEVFELAGNGDPLAQNIINFAAGSIGQGLSNLVNILNPSCLVIGGGVGANREDFLYKIINKIKIESIRPSVNITPLKITTAELEPESGIWGMYSLLTGKSV
ncbi:MAG: ROK family protein [Bacillota bacterium]|nr:ROK family protein [Bacillota bacterium]